ncbi:hypothetical protein HY478_02245 [Candidatus Uhrbacteria bacterium]|nr:hypothetical protein [Candidatus Uhrbacteria bacterium]
MAKSRGVSQFWDDGLKLISFCPLCETHYNPMEAQLVGEEDNSHLLHITCRKCANSMLALVLISPAGVSSVGLITDLSYNDVVKFKRASEVAVDDVLEAHAALEDEERFWSAVRT